MDEREPSWMETGDLIIATIETATPDFCFFRREN
jgi:hypothetical protein